MLPPDLTTLLAVALLVFAAWPVRQEAGAVWSDYRPGRWPNRLLGLLLLSPGLRYVSALFNFPIRLQLSAWAGDLLRMASMDVRTEGNVLIRYGQSGVSQSAAARSAAAVEMAVDPACMGLQLTGVSLLVALFLLIYQEKQDQKFVPVGWVVGYALAAFGLTIVCNLFRIVLLVAFGAMPGTWLHEVIGLVCVAGYAWLPAWGLARLLVRRVGRADTGLAKQPVWAVGWGVGLLAVGLGIMAFAARPVVLPDTVTKLGHRSAGYGQRSSRFSTNYDAVMSYRIGLQGINFGDVNRALQQAGYGSLPGQLTMFSIISQISRPDRSLAWHSEIGIALNSGMNVGNGVNQVRATGYVIKIGASYRIIGTDRFQLAPQLSLASLPFSFKVSPIDNSVTPPLNTILTSPGSAQTATIRAGTASIDAGLTANLRIPTGRRQVDCLTFERSIVVGLDAGYRLAGPAALSLTNDVAANRPTFSASGFYAGLRVGFGSRVRSVTSPVNP